MVIFASLLRSTTWCAVAAILAFGLSPSRAQESCQENMYVAGGPAGKIFVSDSAVLYRLNNCPPASVRLAKSIRLEAGQALWFWFRVQGDLDYLGSTQSRSPFVLAFYRFNGSDYVDDLQPIDMGELEWGAMMNEARGTGGPFDYRMRARKKTFVVPGTYRVVLMQEGREVSCVTPSLFSSCAMVVEVMP